MTMTDETAPAHAEPEWTFEAALARLNEIAEALEGDGMELDDSLALFEEGVRLLRFAETVLAGADARVRQLLEQAGGGFRMDDFPDPL
jgi:exodeoxyribonuclease VII small subunit